MPWRGKESERRPGIGPRIVLVGIAKRVLRRAAGALASKDDHPAFDHSTGETTTRARYRRPVSPCAAGNIELFVDGKITIRAARDRIDFSIDSLCRQVVS